MVVECGQNLVRIVKLEKNEWREVSCTLKARLFRLVVRPAMLLHGDETLALAQVNKMHVAEIRMLRRMTGVTRRDKIRNGYIKGLIVLDSQVSRKIQKSELRWLDLGRTK